MTLLYATTGYHLILFECMCRAGIIDSNRHVLYNPANEVQLRSGRIVQGIMSCGYRFDNTYRYHLHNGKLKTLDRIYTTRRRLSFIKRCRLREVYLAKTNDIEARRIMALCCERGVSVHGVEDGLALYGNKSHELRNLDRESLRGMVYGRLSDPVKVMCSNSEILDVYATHPGMVRSEIGDKEILRIPPSFTYEERIRISKAVFACKDDLSWIHSTSLLVLPHSTLFSSQRHLEGFKKAILKHVDNTSSVAVSYHPRETKPYMDTAYKNLTLLDNEIPAEMAIMCMYNLQRVIGAASTALKSAVWLRDDITTICIKIGQNTSRFENYVAPILFDRTVSLEE